MKLGVQSKYLHWFAGFLLVSVLFFPPLRLAPTLPALELIDFLVPVIFVAVYLKRREITRNKLIVILISFAAYIFLTILVNGRIAEMRDYFEIFKLGKFMLVILLFSLINSGDFYTRWIKPIFVAFVVLNLFHYYDLLNINDFLDKYYLGNERYSQFGLDSAGNPTFKRMLGFAGNPNNNAIVFMFFAILFIPIRNVTLKSYAWFSTALIMMFLCQSRTAMVGLAIIFLVYAVIHRKHLRTVLLTGLCALGSLFISYFITKVSISKSEIAEIAEQSQFEADSLRNLGLNPDSLHRSNQITYLESVVFGEGITGNSMKGRYEVWKHLWTMIKEKPVVGHAPHKEYFYENGLYPESEYVLMAWRYGFIGLFIYLALLFILARLAIKNLQGDFGLKLLLIVLVVAITGLTNNPFANKTILVLFAVVIGLGISEFRNRHSLTAESARKSEEDSNR